MNRRIWAAAQRARDVGTSADHEFIVFNGFTATLSREQLRTVRQDPDLVVLRVGGGLISIEVEELPADGGRTIGGRIRIRPGPIALYPTGT
jgi:hypothetical protein